MALPYPAPSQPVHLAVTMPLSEGQSSISHAHRRPASFSRGRCGRSSALLRVALGPVNPTAPPPHMPVTGTEDAAPARCTDSRTSGQLDPAESAPGRWYQRCRLPLPRTSNTTLRDTKPFHWNSRERARFFVWWHLTIKGLIGTAGLVRGVMFRALMITRIFSWREELDSSR
jgi:hypothetical protein